LEISAGKAGCVNKITLPAGSVDALQDAVNAVCDGGNITLASGTHTEHDGVVISKKVTIKGEHEAILVLHTEPMDDPTYAEPVDVGLHFLNGKASLLQNVDIQSAVDPGGTAVLLEKSSGTSVLDCHFTNFQYTIVVHKSDHTTIKGNVIVSSEAWLDGLIPESDGFINLNGNNTKVSFNEVYNSTFGIFFSDKQGTCDHNYVHHTAYGITLCKWPLGTFVLPSGEATGGEVSCSYYTFSNNVCRNNYLVGYLVIDGANNNHLINNEGGDNGNFDIFMMGLNDDFGIVTPACFDNKLNAGSFNLYIKDCGTNNTIIGGTLSSDPCVY
jgi:hypothetical protein